MAQLMNIGELAWQEAAALMLGMTALVWLGWLTWILLRAVRHYRQLVEKPGESLEGVLTRFLRQSDEQDKAINKLNGELDAIRKAMRTHVQHVGFVRFNPFGKSGTGGDQSFALAILDDKKNGIIISSLHSRSGTRFYAKPVVDGRGKGHPLTQEEAKAVQQSIGDR